MAKMKVKTLIRESCNTKYEITIFDKEGNLTIHEIDYCKNEDKDYGMIKIHSCVGNLPREVMEMRATRFCAGRDRVLEITCEI